MTYFTSWDINVFLCLISIGLPRDLVYDWIPKLNKAREEYKMFILEEASGHYLDRKKYLPTTIVG